jgi:Secretion system C-terminal sorting domain
MAIVPLELSKPCFMKTIIPYTQTYSSRVLGIIWKKRVSSTTYRISLMLLLLATFNQFAYSQNCPTSGTHSQSANENTYYPGTQASVAVGATSITLGTAGAGANFGSTPIAVGDIVFIVQMQGAQINAVNSSGYGANNLTGSGFLSTNLSAGRMEFAVAANAVPLAGGTLNLVSGTTYSYIKSAFGTDGQYTYQVIRVATWFNIQLTGTITTALWNGSTGGVTVLNAVNQLDFNSKTITAVGAGFRGGAGRQLSGAGGTSKTDYMTLSTVNANGSKGEGLAGTTRYINNNGALLDNVSEGYPNGSYARGAPGNAGGGATDSHPVSNDQNAGGGGGANGGVGGQGGWGWFSLGNNGGKGGANFATYASPSRLIMGGGGGAGTSNNGTGTPNNGFASSGSSGGGMVLISATTIIGSGTINASGADANNTVTNDASGGGGAGGSILIYANSGQNGITAIANGGTGGTNDPAATGATRHGPGGGGGGGVIYSNAALNAASTVTGGANGVSSGTDATDNFGAVSGSVGILTQTFPFSQLPPNMQKCQSTILPVVLSSLTATYNSTGYTLVSWSTSNQVNASYFEVERSSDGIHFMPVGQVFVDQSSDPVHNYSYNDNLAGVSSSVLYYRLKLVDADGHYGYSKVVAINLDQNDTKMSVYPNPATDYAVLKIFTEKPGTAIMRLLDESGKQIKSGSYALSHGSNNVMIDQLAMLPKGMYVVQILVNNNLYNQKLIKR